MKQGEDPHIFPSRLKEILGVLLILEVRKDDRTVYSVCMCVLPSHLFWTSDIHVEAPSGVTVVCLIMLKRLPRDY